jgi:hypothetical protein
MLFRIGGLIYGDKTEGLGPLQFWPLHAQFLLMLIKSHQPTKCIDSDQLRPMKVK